MSVGPWVTKWMQERAAAIANGMAELLRHPECRDWLQNLIETLADVPTFDLDPLKQAFLQGRRSVGLDLREAAQKTNFELYYRQIGERANTARDYQAAVQNDADRVPFQKEK